MADDDDEKAGGAPAWMTTYGDMITLLLCFFVLLFTMMELKQERVTRTMRQFQKQFGVLPAYKAQMQVFTQPQVMTTVQANVLRRGPKGKRTSVNTITEDQRTKMTIGGTELFRPDSAELTPAGKQMLREDIAPSLRGFRNRIDIRGHTASSSYEDGWYLGFQRAYAVMEYLAGECNVEWRRFRVTSCADNEPLATNQTAKGRERNRRVEIIMTEEFIRDVDARDM